MNDEPDVKQAGSSAQSASTGIPAYPSGSVNKEVEPGSVSEFLKPSTPELELPEEVERTGATVTPEHPQLKQADRQAGIQPAGESVPAPNLLPLVKFSVSDEEIEENLKAPPTTSRRFLGALEKLIKERIMKDFLRIGG